MNRRHHLHQKQRAPHTQSAPVFIAKQGIDAQLQRRVPQIAAPLHPRNTISGSQRTSPWYGRQEILCQKGGAKKAMNPSSYPSSPPLLSATSDPSAHTSQEGPKTKVIVRGLPPSLSERGFRDSISPRFDELLKWVSFWPGKISMRTSRNSRAYIGFTQPEDVFKFYEEFNGHVFVNEKGSRYKAMVADAPHQGVPKFSFKDNEEGSILADPDYSEFVSGLSKPIELLPSAEVQLERREAEKRSSLDAAKESVVVTPLMQYVRENRAFKEQQASMANRKQVSSHKNSLVAPRPRHNLKACKESVSDKKSETAFEYKDGVVSRGRGPARNRNENQKDENDMGVNEHSASRHARKECRMQQSDLGKKSKHTCGFRSSEKQVWVAKSPGTLAHNSLRKLKHCA